MQLGAPVAAIATPSQLEPHIPRNLLIGPKPFHATFSPSSSLAYSSQSASIFSPLEQIIALNSTALVQSSSIQLPIAASQASATASDPSRPPTSSSSSSSSIISSGELILVGLLISLIIVSIVGNCLVCVAIFTDRRLRKLGNAFIVSLAIADLFVSCLVMTFALCNDLMNYWIFGDWFCDVWISFDIMCSTASILNLCAISLDRFIHIKDCLLYNQWMTRRVAISAVIIIWFISALVSFVPITLGWHKPDHHFGGGGHPSGSIGSLRSLREEERGSGGGGDAREFAWPLEPAAAALGSTNMASSAHVVAGANLSDKLDYPGAYRVLVAPKEEEGEEAGEAASKAIENQSSPHNAASELLSDLDTMAIDYGKTREGWNPASSEPMGREDGGSSSGSGADLAGQGEDFVSSASDDGASSSSSSSLTPLPDAGSSSGQAADGGGEPSADRQSVTETLTRSPVAQFNQVESNSRDGSGQIGGLNPTRSRAHHLTAVSRRSSWLTATNRWPRPPPPSMDTAAQQQQQQRQQRQQQLAYQQSPSGEGQQPNASSAQSHQIAPPALSSPSSSPSASSSSHQAQCMLTLTPTYAIISSTISFYIPCIIMLGLYTKLFACARRHVRNIQAISKAPAPIAISQSTEPVGQMAAVTTFTNPAQQQQQPHLRRPPPLKTWLKFGPKTKPNSESKLNTSNAQSHDDKLIKANQHNKKQNNNRTSGNSSSRSTRCRPASVHKLLNRNSSSPRAESFGQNEICKRDLTQTSLAVGGADSQPLPASTDSRIELQQQMDQIDQTDNPSDGTIIATLSEKDKTSAHERIDNLIMTASIEQRPDFSQSRPQISPKPRLELSSSEPRQGQQQQLHHDSRGPEEGQPFLNQCQSRSVSISGGHAGLSRSKSCSTKKAPNRVNFQGPNQQQSGQLATHKAAITLGIIMGTFLFCWVPFFCLNIIKAFCIDCIPSSMFRAFTWLGYANSALNPIIYGIHNSEFRCAFNKIFFKHLNIKNSRYYINRRFSYDLRHPAAQTNRQQNSYGHTNSSNAHQHQTLKSDAVT